MTKFRGLLDQTFQRFKAWLGKMGGRLPWAAAWRHESLPVLEGLEAGEMSFISDPQDGRWKADVSYHYRSLDCYLRVSAYDSTPGMQRICEILQGIHQD